MIGAADAVRNDSLRLLEKRNYPVMRDERRAR